MTQICVVILVSEMGNYRGKLPR